MKVVTLDILKETKILLNPYNMKKLGILVIAMASLTIGAFAQKFQPSPKSVLTQIVGTTEVTINYHRPGLKGRSMESLAPKGQVWRTGANQATEITFSKNVKMGGQNLTAGTYSIYTIPGTSEWTIIINEKLSWGTQYSKEKDVLRFPCKVSTSNQSTETFTIDISDISKDGTIANLELRWGNIVVKAPIEVTL